MKTLPDKPSELLRVALGDLEKCEKDPNYIIMMNDWHTVRGDKCAVCLAGVVIAKSLEANVEWNYDPDNYDRTVRHKLRALNQFRTGSNRAALGFMGIAPPEGLKNFVASQYHMNSKKFKTEMNDTIEQLQGFGL